VKIEIHLESPSSAIAIASDAFEIFRFNFCSSTSQARITASLKVSPLMVAARVRSRFREAGNFLMNRAFGASVACGDCMPELNIPLRYCYVNGTIKKKMSIENLSKLEQWALDLAAWCRRKMQAQADKDKAKRQRAAERIALDLGVNLEEAFAIYDDAAGNPVWFVSPGVRK